MHRSLVAMGLSVSLLGACSVDNGIMGSDTTYFPTVRALIDASHFEEGTQVQAGPADPEGTDRDVEYRMGMEISLTGANGDFVPDGPFFSEAEHTMVEVSVAGRGGVILEDQLTLELIGGLGFNYAKIEGSGPGGVISDGEGRVGLLLGTQVGWEPIRNVELYGRATVLPLFFEAASVQLEAGLQVNVLDELGLLLAYRWWRFEAEDIENPFEFDLFDGSDPIGEIELSGVTFGVVLEF